MSDVIFMDGFIVKSPNENAPDFVKANISIKKDEFISFLNKQEGDWVNAQLKVSRAGKLYASIDNWKPNAEAGSGFTPEKIDNLEDLPW